MVLDGPGDDSYETCNQYPLQDLKAKVIDTLNIASDVSITDNDVSIVCTNVGSVRIDYEVAADSSSAALAISYSASSNLIETTSQLQNIMRTLIPTITVKSITRPTIINTNPACTGSLSFAHDPNGECKSWCNPFVCYKTACSGCPLCSAITNGGHCAWFCNKYTCDADDCLCKGCSQCSLTERANRCDAWCSIYTCDKPDCIACQLCQDKDKWCEGWCNPHTCKSEYCKGCNVCGYGDDAVVPTAYVVTISFQASGDVSDYDDAAQTIILNTLATAAGFSSNPAGSTIAITAASVDVVGSIAVSSQTAATQAQSTFTSSVASATALASLLSTAGVSMTVLTNPTVEVIEDTGGATPTPTGQWPASSWSRSRHRSRILRVF